jgi:spore coat-associated protein N
MAVTLILILGALGIALAALIGMPDGNRKAPTLDVINRSGVVQISNSREGLPIISVGNLRPGQTASGQVTLKNTGTARGYIYLAPLGLVSPPGPKGGTLADNLTVRVSLIKGGATSRKYNSVLSKMGTVTAGRFAPGENGTFQFEVQAKNTGMPPPPTRSRPMRGDNKYQGAIASVTFGWSTTPG